MELWACECDGICAQAEMTRFPHPYFTAWPTEGAALYSAPRYKLYIYIYIYYIYIYNIYIYLADKEDTISGEGKRRGLNEAENNKGKVLLLFLFFSKYYF